MAYFTVTPICRLVQQHWSPPPPAPVESFPSMRSTYSPGAENVALTVDLPLAALSIDGRTLSNFTSPGPRYFDQLIASGGGGVNPSGSAGTPARPPAPRPAAA